MLISEGARLHPETEDNDEPLGFVRDVGRERERRRAFSTWLQRNAINWNIRADVQWDCLTGRTEIFFAVFQCGYNDAFLK